MKDIIVHNVETNEIIVRPMTDDEIAQIEQEKIVAEREIKAAAEAAAAKAALLAKLGITEEEAKLLLS